jgi:hypothetical protein
VLDRRILPVIVLLGVPVRLIRRHFRWDVLRDQPPRPVLVLPVDVTELLIECLQDAGEPVQFRLWPTPAAASRCGSDFGVFVSEGDSHGGALLHPITVHVDGFEEAAREILLFWGR